MSGARPFCPYVGLAPFEKAHETYFFGRGIDSAVLADNVLARPITVFYGASGAGKSSVLNVGLPRALRELGVDARIVTRREWHEPSLLQGWLRDAADKARNMPARPLMLVLDQFEEYFNYRTSAAGEPFERALARLLADKKLETHLVLSLRSDGLHLLDTLRLRLPGLLDTTLELGHLDEDSVREAIEKPIGEYNEQHRPAFALDPDFATTLITQLRPAGEKPRIELAYLQLALEKIWEAEVAAGSTTLRTATLTTRLEGVKEIVRQHVEDVMRGLGEEDRRRCAAVFDRLVTPSGGKILLAAGDLAAFAKVGKAELDPVLVELATGENRLLRRVDLPGGSGTRGYEIIHDVLAEPILKWKHSFEAEEDQQRASDEAAKRARQEAEVAAREARVRDEAEKQLALAQAAERERLAAAREQASRDRQKIVTYAGVAVLVVFALTVAAAYLAFQYYQRAISAESVVNQRLTQLRATQSRIALSEGRPVEAMLVALEGLPRSAGDPDRPHFAPGEAALWAAWQASHERAYLAGHEDWVTAVAWSPDGQRLASASWDNTLRVWRVFPDLWALIAHAQESLPVGHKALTTGERRDLLLDAP